MQFMLLCLVITGIFLAVWHYNEYRVYRNKINYLEKSGYIKRRCYNLHEAKDEIYFVKNTTHIYERELIKLSLVEIMERYK